jgi:hypothetical protein
VKITGRRPEKSKWDKSQKTYLQGSLAVFFLSLALFVYAGLFSLSGDARSLVYELFEKEGCFQKELDLSGGPKIGDALISNTQLQKIENNNTTLLLFVGSCSPCYKSAVKFITTVAKEKNHNIFIVYYEDYDELTLKEFKDLDIDTIFDEDRTLHRKFNAVFLPRCFEIDEYGRINWMQKQVGISTIVERINGGEK